MKPDKQHRDNIVTIYPSQKYPINQRERTEPHGSKTHNKVSDISYTEGSNYKQKSKMTNSRMNDLTKTKKMLKIQKKGRY